MVGASFAKGFTGAGAFASAFGRLGSVPMLAMPYVGYKMAQSLADPNGDPFMKLAMLAEFAGGFAGGLRAKARSDFQSGFGKSEAMLNRIIHEGSISKTWLHKPASWAAKAAGFKACFSAGTPIRTPEGSRLIEELRVGDMVLSRDEHNPDGVIVAQRVEEVFARNGLIWELRIGGQTIRSTAEHPFYRDGDGWVALHLLRVGDRLKLEDGSWSTIEGVRDTGRYEAVYNFRVREFHTYFVGDETTWGWAVWAHNMCTPEELARLQAISADEGLHPMARLEAQRMIVEATLLPNSLYHPHTIRSILEARYPGRVVSTTVPAMDPHMNVPLAGRRHPNGTVFDDRGVPIFDDVARATVQILESTITRPGVKPDTIYRGQLRRATQELRDAIQRGDISKDLFNTEQLAAINKGLAQIPEYTWHHHQSRGRMQLVPRDIHKEVHHLGGFELWYGH